MNTDVEETDKLIRYVQQGGSLRMLFDIDISADLGVLHRYARQLVCAEEYSAAAKIFKVLVICDAWSFEYWFELGTCYQLDSDWKQAIYAYGRAAKLNVSQAHVPCAAGECYLACGNLPMAAKAFRAALLVCGTAYPGDHLEDIRQRARAGLNKTGEKDEPNTN